MFDTVFSVLLGVFEVLSSDVVLVDAEEEKVTVVVGEKDNVSDLDVVIVNGIKVVGLEVELEVE